MVELILINNERSELYKLVKETISEGINDLSDGTISGDIDYHYLEGIQTKLQAKSIFPPDLTIEEASELTDLLDDKLRVSVEDKETATIFNSIYKQLVGRDHGKYEAVYGNDA